MPDDREIRARIEAALYSAGRPLSLSDLERATGVSSRRKLTAITREIARDIRSSLLAVEVVELVAGKFVMQLKPELNQIAKKFAFKPLLPQSVLKTLSYVVYFQPVTGKEVALNRGPQAYRHLRTLADFGFISSEKHEKTRLYRTTAAFADYFGLNSDPEIMKGQLLKMGIAKP